VSAVNVGDTSPLPGGAPLRVLRHGARRSDGGRPPSRPGWGVMCLTLCRRCASFDGQIPVSVSTGARLVGQHCQHLGITVDEMAAAMEAGR
jgi:hypothetical protein